MTTAQINVHSVQPQPMGSVLSVETQKDQGPNVGNSSDGAQHGVGRAILSLRQFHDKSDDNGADDR